MEDNLTGKRVRLEPLADEDYFINLAVKSNKYQYSREQVIKTLNEYEKHFWRIFSGDKSLGVVGYFKGEGNYLMEALKDHSQSVGVSYSVEVGNLFLDYMSSITDKIRTCAKEDDLGIQVLCKKLGFIEINRLQGIVIYEKELRCQ